MPKDEDKDTIEAYIRVVKGIVEDNDLQEVVKKAKN